MHICLLNDVFYPEIQGDVVRIYKDLLVMKAAGYKVTLVSPNQGKKNINCYQVSKNQSLFISLPRAVLDIHKKNKVDVIWINRYAYILPMFLIAKIIKAKLICEIHGPERKEMMLFSHSIKKIIYNFIYKINEYAIKLSDKVIVVEKNLSRWLENELKVINNKIIFIGNYPDLTIFKPDFKKNKSFIIGYLGTLQRGRIDPLYNLIEKKKKYNYSIIGEGEDRQRILNYQKKYKNIYYHSENNYETIPFYIKKFNLGIVISLDSNIEFSEKGPPMKLFEYLACGIPVLAINLLDIKSLLEENGLGLVVDSNDLEMGIEKIRKKYFWYRNNVIKFRKIMKENYSWEKEKIKIVKILEEFERKK